MAEVDGIPAPIKEIIDRTLSMVHALTGAVEAIQTVADKNKLLETVEMMKRGVEDERHEYMIMGAMLDANRKDQLEFALNAMEKQIAILDDCTERLRRRNVVDAMASLQVSDA